MSYLANPFFPLGGLSLFEANSSTCFSTANSSASARRLRSTNKLVRTKSYQGRSDNNYHHILQRNCEFYQEHTLGSVFRIHSRLRGHGPSLRAHGRAIFARTFHCSENFLCQMDFNTTGRMPVFMWFGGAPLPAHWYHYHCSLLQQKKLKNISFYCLRREKKLKIQIIK